MCAVGAEAQPGFRVDLPRPQDALTRQRQVPVRRAVQRVRRIQAMTEQTNRRGTGIKRAPRKPGFLPPVERPQGTTAVRHGNPTGVLEFPGVELGRLLLETKKQNARPVSLRIRKEQLERLRTVLPLGRYRFSGACALELGLGRLRPGSACLGSKESAALISELRVDAPDLSYYSSPHGGTRSFHGVMALVRADFGDTGVILHWVAEELIYANPYLEALRRRFPHLPEQTRLHSAYVSLVLPELLQIAAEEKHAEGITEVLKPGDSLYFSEHCPLRVVSGPEHSPAEVRLRLTLAMSCPAASRLGRIAIIVPGEVALPELLRRGARLTGHVRLAGIVRQGRQLRMVWDSISNIRILEQ